MLPFRAARCTPCGAHRRQGEVLEFCCGCRRSQLTFTQMQVLTAQGQATMTIDEQKQCMRSGRRGGWHATAVMLTPPKPTPLLCQARPSHASQPACCAASGPGCPLVAHIQAPLFLAGQEESSRPQSPVSPFLQAALRVWKECTHAGRQPGRRGEGRGSAAKSTAVAAAAISLQQAAPRLAKSRPVHGTWPAAAAGAAAAAAVQRNANQHGAVCMACCAGHAGMRPGSRADAAHLWQWAAHSTCIPQSHPCPQCPPPAAAAGPRHRQTSCRQSYQKHPTLRSLHGTAGGRSSVASVFDWEASITGLGVWSCSVIGSATQRTKALPALT